MTVHYVYTAKTRNEIITALEVARASLRFASKNAYDRRDFMLGARLDAEAEIVDTALKAIDKAEAGAA